MSGTPPTVGAARPTTALLAVLAIGLVIRCVFVDHPFDARTLMAWREADYVQLARNFLREDWSLFHPRVDWRGSTSGLAEVELPLIPWIGALLYRLFGYHEEILRVLSAALSCGALLAFTRLSRRLLAPAGALAAVALYAVNPLLFGISGGIQPEPLLLVLSVLAADALLQYADAATPQRLLIACAWLGAAMLAKSPAVHLGLLTAFLVLRHEGRIAFRSWHVYAGAALALLPPLAWYAWAHGHYLDTGLSFGVSNETHLISTEMILHPGGWLVTVHPFVASQDPDRSAIGRSRCCGRAAGRGSAGDGRGPSGLDRGAGASRSEASAPHRRARVASEA